MRSPHLLDRAKFNKLTAAALPYLQHPLNIDFSLSPGSEIFIVNYILRSLLTKKTGIISAKIDGSAFV